MKFETRTVFSYILGDHDPHVYKEKEMDLLAYNMCVMMADDVESAIDLICEAESLKQLSELELLNIESDYNFQFIKVQKPFGMTSYVTKYLFVREGTLVIPIEENK